MRALNHVQPTLRTWTILLSVFTFNRQPRAAERIKEMMAKRNIKYDQVTWNIIVNSFINDQDVEKSAAAIRAMEDEGFEIDHYVMRALRYLHEPERLWIALEEMDQLATEQARLTKTTTAPDVRNARERDDELLERGLRRLTGKRKE